MNNKFLAWTTIVFFSIASQILATDLIVDGIGVQPNHYTTIQAAYTAAISGSDTILLESGMTFTGAGNYNITVDKNLTFSSAGTVTPIVNLQTSGNLFTIGSGNTVTINNWDIRNGRASSGGAIDVESGTLNTTNCIFNANTTTYAYQKGGGAIYISDSSTLNAADCIFSENDARNSSTGGGGAIMSLGTVQATNCIFTGNKGYRGGAIYIGDVNLNASGCIFTGNSSTMQGGAIYNYGSSNTITISYSRLANNTASAGYAISNPFDTNVIATNNWWGTNNPNSTTLFDGTVSYNPWVTMALSDNPSVVAPGGSTLLTTDFTKNSTGDTLSSFVPNIPVGYSAEHGTVNPTLAYTIDGIATSTLTLDYSGLAFIASSTAGPGDENYSLTLTITPSSLEPGIFVQKFINANSTSTYLPGVIVPENSAMNISYIVTNTGNVTLTNITVTDDQGYVITHPTTTLDPDLYMTCTATAAAPTINQQHKDIGTVIGTTLYDASTATASATAYATSIPVNPYRFNFGCICSDTEDAHIFVGSRNIPSLTNNTLECWIFDASATPTCNFAAALDLGSHIIMDSATYNNDNGMNLLILTNDQDGTCYLNLALYDGTDIVKTGSIALSSPAFKAQLFMSRTNNLYAVTDELDRLSIYSIDLSTHTFTLTSSVSNLASNLPSAFLRTLPQEDSFYIIQGYGNNYVATYAVDLTTGIVSDGSANGMSSTFSTINSCATCYDSLTLGGTNTGNVGTLAQYTIDISGDLVFTQSTNITDTSTVNYCERCCCNNSWLLAGTDNGLYSFDPDTLALQASMASDDWINTCWCCDINADYCIAVKNNHQSYIVQQVGSSLNEVLAIPN